MDKKRRIQSIVEVGTSADGAIQLSPMYSMDVIESRVVWKREPGLTQFRDALSRSNVRLSRPGALVTFSDSN